MKQLIKILAILGFLGFVLFVVVIMIMPSPRLPKEADVIGNFNEHRAVFEELRDMLIADKNLSRLAEWGVEIRKPFFMGYPFEQNFPNARFKKYLALLKECGGGVATRGEDPHPDPGIVVWAWGWAGDTRHVGICWLDEAPTNQVKSLTNYRGNVNGDRSAVFRHIDQNWYL